MSIHIGAKKGDIAEKVLLPGDPQRAKYIADNFLTNAVCYSTVRGMLGYTGEYNGEKVSVQATGMGIPSISIVVTELIDFYGAKRLIRVGSCGAIQPELKLKDMIIAIGASTDSNVNNLKFDSCNYSATASYNLLARAVEVSKSSDINTHVGNILSSDTFYYEDYITEPLKPWQAHNILAVEMEAAGLYTIAARKRVEALTLLSVSDQLITGENLTSDERETGLAKMINVALDI